MAMRRGRRTLYGCLSGRGGRAVRVARCGAVRDGAGPSTARTSLFPGVAALVSPFAVNRTYTLAGDCMSVREFAERCNAVFGSRSRIVGVRRLVVSVAAAVSRFLPRPIFPDQLARLRTLKRLASSDVREHLGFEPQALAAHLAVLAAG